MKDEKRWMAGVSVNQPYNGWSNYPTWCILLHLHDDVAFFDELVKQQNPSLSEQEQIERIATELEEHYTELEEYYEALMEETADRQYFPSSLLLSSFLLYVLELVNWYEIAEVVACEVRDRVKELEER